MSEQRSVSGNITHTFLVQIPNYILGIAAGILLTRQLGPEGKGVYTLVLTNIQLLVMFLGLNLPGAIQYFMASKKMNVQSLTGIGLLMLVFGTMIVFYMLFILPGSGNFLMAEGYDNWFFRCYIFISFVVTNFNALLTGFLQGHHRFREVNRVSLLNSILNFVIFVSLFYISKNGNYHPGIEDLLLYTIYILGANTLLLVIYFRKYVPLNSSLNFSFRDVIILFRFLIPAYISVLVNFFNYRLTIWLVSDHESLSALGYFSLALNLAQMMLMVTLAINTVLFPHFASKTDWESAARDFGFALKINMALMFFATIVLVLFSSFLIPLFYGDLFLPATEPVQILAIGTFFCSQAQVFGHFLGARNKNWINTWIYAISLAFLGILGLILVPDYGINGAALASGGSYLLMFTLFTLTVKFGYGISFRSMFMLTKNDFQRAKNILSRFLNKG
ncbi:MAG: flippase [Bacteroidota bacterium]